MKPTAPPLHLLNTFEVAARLLSFKKAAYELNVSPPAVSQQIKLLEDHVDVRLFQREAGGVYLTKVGAQLYELAEDVLMRYRAGYQAIRQSHETPIVRISTISHIALNMLIPSLPAFQQNNPQVDLRIETCEDIVDFNSDWIYGAVRIGQGDWPNLKCIKLCDLNVSLVASPEFIKAMRIESPEDFNKLTLIHSRTHIDDWQRFSNITGIDTSKNKQVYLDSYLSAIAAVESGAGVAIGMMPLLQRALKEGRLAELVNQNQPIKEAVYFAYPAKAEDEKYFELIKDWLIEQFKTLTNP